jgi:hypothetical protein
MPCCGRGRGFVGQQEGPLDSAEALVLADERRQGALNEGTGFTRGRVAGTWWIAVGTWSPSANNSLERLTRLDRSLEHELREPVADALHEVELPADWTEVLTNDAQAALFPAGFRAEMVSGPTSFVSTTRTKAAATALWRLPKGHLKPGFDSRPTRHPWPATTTPSAPRRQATPRSRATGQAA